MASSSRSSRGPGAAGARGLASGESGGLSVTHSHQLLQKVLVVATPAGPQGRGVPEAERSAPSAAGRMLSPAAGAARPQARGQG